MPHSTRFVPSLILLAALLDIALVTVFAAIGRGSHERSATLSGLWQTAWPFLAGIAVGWLVLQAWRRPSAPLRVGLPLALIAVSVGMLLRALVGQGTALPFILVAAGTITLFVCGWRWIATAIFAVRRKRAH